MNWEAVTALGTVFTGIVIFATVLIGWRELDQVRRSNQLDGVMRIAERMGEERYQHALQFVLREYAKRLEDPDFRAEIGTPQSNDEKRHPEIIVLLEHELIGTFIKHRLLAGDTIYDLCGSRLYKSWKILEPSVEIARRLTGNGQAWSNTEWVSLRAQAWIERQQ